MSLFDELVRHALQNQKELLQLRPVVEKELLHHDVIREMHQAGLLTQLVFIGGTCLRACYGAERLSEDLDFTGGKNFNKQRLSALTHLLKKRLHDKYGLQVEISEPSKESGKETGNVSTWKIKITTQSARKNLPKQRINIDICAIPSYDARPVLLRNHYGVDMGTSHLILQAQSREEILADKWVALALRPNRIKNRDLWDIVWLKQQAVQLPVPLIAKKIKDHHWSRTEFLKQLQTRLNQLREDPQLRTDFTEEMRRFLPVKTLKHFIETEHFWSYLVNLLEDEAKIVIHAIKTS